MHAATTNAKLGVANFAHAYSYGTEGLSAFHSFPFSLSTFCAFYHSLMLYHCSLMSHVYLYFQNLTLASFCH